MGETVEQETGRETLLSQRDWVLPSGDSDGLLPTSLRLAEGQGFLFPPLQDVQNKLKESAQCVGDEFMNCKLAARAKVLTWF